MPSAAQAVIAVLARRRQHHHRRAAELGSRRDFRRHREAVHLGHVRIEQHEPNGWCLAGRGRRSRSTRGAPAIDQRRLHPPARDPVQQHPAIHRVVVDDEHRQAASASVVASVASVTSSDHGEVKRAAGVGHALDPDASAHQPDERRRDRQAKTSAAEPARRRSVSLAKRLEDGVVFVRGNADAGVGDADVQSGASLGVRLFAVGRSTYPCSVNFIALPTRFDSTCLTRVGSPITPTGTSGATSHVSSSPFWCARGRAA